jgi:tRNA pseudouridine55 synthase
MSVINDLKQLVGNSRLFVDADKLEKRGKGKIPTKGKRAREIVKIGQGGTLDPLADGVLGMAASRYPRSWSHLIPVTFSSSRRCRKRDQTSQRVLGLCKGTSSMHRRIKVQGFTEIHQEYRTTALLGCETDTYDSEGSRVRVAPWRHVTREAVESALNKFRGEIHQAPPM